MNPFLYFWLFLKASLFSSGGTGNLPSLQTDLIAAHAARNRQFAEALLIGQISPGPTGLWSVSLGYLTRGVFGGIAALIAATLPPLLVLVVDRIYRRIERHPAVEGFVRGLSLAIVGIFVVIMLRLLGSAGESAAKSGAFDYRTIVTAVCAITAGTFRRIPVPVILAAAGIAGVIIYRF